MAEEPELTVLKRSLVFPAMPTKEGAMYLSCLDLMWRHISYNTRLLFYNSASQDCFHILKTSLSIALVHYYPWAGRIAEENDNRLVINCNDAGVEFVEASIDLEMSELAKEGFQMRTMFQKLCQQVDNLGDRMYSTPLLSVQATKFTDGGISLGIALNHVVADGHGLWNFMVSWGEFARGLGLSLPPVHNRKLLAFPNPSPLMPKPKLIQFQLEDAENGHAHSTDVVNGDKGKQVVSANGGVDHLENTKIVDPTPSQIEPTMQCVFNLSTSAIKALKAEAGGSFTSFEVICAHFWQRTTAARLLPPTELCVVGVLANCRTRVTPPLPAGYCGNAIIFNEASGLAGDICNEELAKTAARIHEVVLNCGKENVGVFMNWLELNDCAIFTRHKPVGISMNVASSPRFPVYQVDFGWGQPAAVRSVKLPCDGEMVLFGGRPGSCLGDVEVCFGIKTSAMARLLKDPLFLAKSPTNPFTGPSFPCQIPY